MGSVNVHESSFPLEDYRLLLDLLYKKTPKIILEHKLNVARQILNAGPDNALPLSLTAYASGEAVGVATLFPMSTGARGTGHVGMMECVDDDAVMRAITDDLCIRSRALGFQSLLGPIQRSTWIDFRIPIEGGAEPYDGEPFSGLHLHTLLEKSGWTPYVHHETYICSASDALKIPLPDPMDTRHKIRELPIEDVPRATASIHAIVCGAFGGTESFDVPPQEYFEKFVHSGIGQKKTRWCSAYDTSTENLVGFCFGYTDNVRPDRFVIKSMGIDPRFQGKGVGTGLLRAMERLAAQNHELIIYSTIRSDNTTMKSMLPKSSKIMRHYATYRIDV